LSSNTLLSSTAPKEENNNAARVADRSSKVKQSISNTREEEQDLETALEELTLAKLFSLKD